MAWEHFEIKKSGMCRIKNDNKEVFECEYKMGTISTGKSRVFWGYKILIDIGDELIVGRSQGYSETYSLALSDCINKLKSLGFDLLVAGNTKSYSESPMSGPAGYGYIKGKKDAVDCMSFCDD